MFPPRWTSGGFPQARPSRRGYLIVWADEDEGQEGLHASFKLSINGEYVILADTDAEIVDSVSFGSQIVDLTMARVPNGTGPFVQGEPTFNAENGDPAAAADAFESVGLFPNAPDPFSARTILTFRTADREAVKLEVFDLQGRRLATLVDAVLPPGVTRIEWLSHGVASGVYLCRLGAGRATSAERVVVVK